jgi:GNAT superfamily N-acetyltransferase
MHPGNFRHHLSNGLRGADPSQSTIVYEPVPGEIAALVVFDDPEECAFDLVVHPDHRTHAFETEIVAWATERAWAMAQSEAADADVSAVASGVITCDDTRRDVLVGLGYMPSDQPDKLTLHHTVRELDVIPKPVWPDGFTVRAAQGIHEADALGEVHAKSFGSNWPPGAYLKVMQTPAYDYTKELVVVAPDGRLAAFLVYWLDSVSKTGLFEPVGCHEDFQRRGLTKALMFHAMSLMREAGMTHATVEHETPEENPAAAALYASVGFKSDYVLSDYVKYMR